MNYREAIDFIYGHTNYEAVPRPHAEGNYDLRRMYEILESLGNPHLKSRSLHIAGTNGKGSTAAMLASVLTESGYTTGLYTSPHLVTSRERFAIDRTMISEAELADIVTRICPEVEASDRKATYGKLTVFEILTVLSFFYFAEKPCLFQVMEVGMGGQFDATNVINPELCFITSISYDHTDILGKTLTQIAGEKCGIIKPGCVVISHPQTDEADAVIEKTCQEKGVRLVKVGREITRRSIMYDFEHQELGVQGRLGKYEISIPLLGQYQLDNTAAVIAGLEVLVENGVRISKESIFQGFLKVNFPGRMQILERNPLVVVDGGHNPSAAHNLKLALSPYLKRPSSVLVIGIAADKDIPGIASELAPIFKNVITTRANSPRSAKPEIIAEEFARSGIQPQITNNVPEAISYAKKLASPEDLICITGSLYVVGEAIAYLKGYASTG
jgi:dihydrofolate synthase / folylpolyglutamate synthase